MPQPLLVLNTLEGPLQAVLEIQATLVAYPKLLGLTKDVYSQLIFECDSFDVLKNPSISQ